MTFLEKIKQKIKNCPKCKGNFHYRNKNKELVACGCKRENAFLQYYPLAEIIQEYVTKEQVVQVRKWMQKTDIFCACIMNYTLRKKFKHSAAYVGAKSGLYTKIYTDDHLIQSVFDRVDIESNDNALKNYLDPDFLILELGITVNRNFIGSHILSLLEKRLGIGQKKTFIVIPDGNCLKSKYDCADLHNYLTKELKEKDTYEVILKESKI